MNFKIISCKVKFFKDLMFYLIFFIQDGKKTTSTTLGVVLSSGGASEQDSLSIFVSDITTSHKLRGTLSYIKQVK